MFNKYSKVQEGKAEKYSNVAVLFFSNVVSDRLNLFLIHTASHYITASYPGQIRIPVAPIWRVTMIGLNPLFFPIL